MNKIEAQSVYTKIWEIMKKYGFDSLNEDEIIALLQECEIEEQKYQGHQLRLWINLATALNKYYGEISHGNDT